MAGAQGERWLARVGGDEVHTATRCCRIRLQPLACRSQQSTDRTGSRVSPLVYGSPCSRVCRLDPKSQRRTCRARWLLTSLRNRLRPRPSLSTPYAHQRNRAISLLRSASETPASAEREWRSTRPRPRVGTAGPQNAAIPTPKSSSRAFTARVPQGSTGTCSRHSAG
jgi:hypothetical protein